MYISVLVLTEEALEMSFIKLLNLPAPHCPQKQLVTFLDIL